MRYTTAEDVLADLVTDIKAVVIGSETMKNCERHHQEDYENYEYPSSFLNDVRRDRTRYLQDVIKILHTVVVVVFDYSMEGDLGTRLDALIRATIDKILDDVTRGNKVYNTKVVRVVTDEGFLEPHCVGILTLELTYLSRV